MFVKNKCMWCSACRLPYTRLPRFGLHSKTSKPQQESAPLCMRLDRWLPGASRIGETTSQPSSHLLSTAKSQGNTRASCERVTL